MSVAKIEDLFSQAVGATPALSPQEGARLAHDPDTLLVDVREKSELEKTGTLSGSVHLPRSHLEFRADPNSLTYERQLDAGRRLVTYCASGKRASLAAKTLQDMGYARVAHIADGGFDALKAAGAPIRSASK